MSRAAGATFIWSTQPFRNQLRRVLNHVVPAVDTFQTERDPDASRPSAVSIPILTGSTTMPSSSTFTGNKLNRLPSSFTGTELLAGTRLVASAVTSTDTLPNAESDAAAVAHVEQDISDAETVIALHPALTIALFVSITGLVVCLCCAGAALRGSWPRSQQVPAAKTEQTNLLPGGSG